MNLLMQLELPVLLVTVLALVGAGAVQGSTGFGFNMVAAPILAVVNPVFVPGPMLVLAGLVCVGGMIRERQFVDTKGLGFSLGGRVIASCLAVLLLGMLDEATFSLFFGSLVLFAVVLSIAGLRITATPRTLFGAGAISGLMGTLTSIGAPPMAMVYQNSEGPVMRATLNAFFVLGAAISLVALSASGHMGWAQLWLALLLTPFAFLGFLFSHWGRALVDKGRVRIVVLTVSASSALILIAKQFVS